MNYCPHCVQKTQKIPPTTNIYREHTHICTNTHCPKWGIYQKPQNLYTHIETNEPKHCPHCGKPENQLKLAQFGKHVTTSSPHVTTYHRCENCKYRINNKYCKDQFIRLGNLYILIATNEP